MRTVAATDAFGLEHLWIHAIFIYGKERIVYAVFVAKKMGKKPENAAYHCLWDGDRTAFNADPKPK